MMKASWMTYPVIICIYLCHRFCIQQAAQEALSNTPLAIPQWLRYVEETSTPWYVEAFLRDLESHFQVVYLHRQQQ
eukprot:COSAG01_NODE_7917_length_2993_cov_94.191431_2_plen_76_part_00